MAAYSGCGERDGGIGHGERRSRGPRWRELAGTFNWPDGGSVADGRHPARSGMARSRARARLNCSSQGQRRGRCRVNRRAERVRRGGCTDKTPECIKVRGPSGVVSCPHVTPRMLPHRPISRHVGTATTTVFLAPPAPAAVAQAAPALGPRWSGGCWTTPATARESATPPPSEAPPDRPPAPLGVSPALSGPSLPCHLPYQTAWVVYPLP